MVASIEAPNALISGSVQTTTSEKTQPQEPTATLDARHASVVQTNVWQVQVPPFGSVQRTRTWSSVVVVSPVSVVMVLLVQLGAGYWARHVVSAGHSVVRDP